MHELKLLIPLNFDSVAKISTACVSLVVYKAYTVYFSNFSLKSILQKKVRVAQCRQLKKLQLSDTIGPTGLLYEYCSY